MKSSMKITGRERRASILKTAGKVFVEKGFSRTTTRQLAEAAGVSEGLLFKHFPSKESLYSAIERAAFEDVGTKIAERARSLKPSTSALAFLVRDLVWHILGGQPDEDGRLFFRLVIRSLMDEGAFARLAIRGGPSEWVRKLAECIEAAEAAGDMLDVPLRADLAGWFVHLLLTSIMLHSLPGDSVIDCEVPRQEFNEQVIGFCLRGLGLKEKAVRRWSKDIGAGGP